jgi:hypothetical protein
MQGTDKAKQLLAAGAISMMLLPQPASATLPRAEPPSYSAYGPFQLCTDRFAIDVGKDEALHIVGDITRIINDRELIAIKSGNSPDYLPASPLDTVFNRPAPGGSNAGPVKLSPKRFKGKTPDAGQTVRYAPQGLRDEDVRYILAPAKESGDALIAGATSFDGSPNDRRLLSRIKPASAKSPECLQLSALFNRDLDDKDAKRAYDLSNSLAGIYPSKPETAPLFHCFSGIGFTLEAGETLLRPWRPLGDAGDFHIGTGGSRITIARRFYQNEKLRPGDPSNLGEHPMSLLRKTEVIYHPSRGIGPPYAEPGEREAGSWEVKLIESYHYGVTFRFPASQHTAAGFRFLERLQFVRDDDPRCQKAS